MLIPSVPVWAIESVDVEAIKKKYWARGDESELGVVQNRLYTKTNKVAFSLLGGLVSADPFLDVKALGGSLGYHLNEYFGIYLMGWKASAASSSALETFERVSRVTANTNKPQWYLGSELAASLVYGKLSLLGRKIIYYDLHFLAGLGATRTESGTSLTPSFGIGQAIWLTHQLALRIDYRLMPYREDIVEKVRPSLMGQIVDSRTNWSNVVTLGATFLLGGSEQ
ncbi:MAG: hypothetical protein A2Z97_08195 [Bdellovibrionales bacterium GWB1_52_6]|nr:MAG: hypothetical protein A2Z97_08195 [Bdellovibrionales bacterium GWB1_52_6]